MENEFLMMLEQIKLHYSGIPVFAKMTRFIGASLSEQRLSFETVEQRVARLVQMRSCQQQRLSSETEEQRAVRSVQLRRCQR